MRQSHALSKPNTSENQLTEQDCNCLLDFLLLGSLRYPEKTVFSDVDSNLHETPITYAQFFFQVKEHALDFKNKNIKKGDRCLLIFDQSVEFIAAFLACHWIGAIPVPLNTPGRLKSLDKWENIARECQPVAIITGEKTAPRLSQSLSRSASLSSIQFFPVRTNFSDKPEKHMAAQPDVHPIAFLQYTSGSTGNPKGVVVTQDSLIKNSRESKKNMNASSESVFVSWLPFYHDMGLILFIVQTIYNGSSLYLMKPEDFMNKPLNWVHALSKWKGTHTGGPNFAYQLVADKLFKLHQQYPNSSSDTQISLKHLKMCTSGAEPIRLKTICDFQNAVALFGAPDHVISPGYGLAEATLTVSLNKEGEKVKWLKVDKKALKKNRIVIQQTGYMETGQHLEEEENSVYLVGNGRAIDGHGVDIVNVAQTGSPLPDSFSKLNIQGPYTIGELWFSGPSVTEGYYDNKEATSENYFHSAEDDTTYLRTGDLAFKDEEGQVYIAGRIKDLIIIRGLNYYPQDLERSSCYSHPDLRIDGAAAFSISKNANESCVIVQELNRSAMAAPKFSEYTKEILTAVLRDYGVVVERILFVPPMHVPRTTSGKIQRSLAKKNTEQEVWENILHTYHLSTIAVQREHNSRSAGLKMQLPDQLRGALKLFLKTRVDSYTIDERRCIPPYVMTEFARMGLMGLTIPTASGGLGLGLGQAREIIETISSADLTLGLFVSLHNLLGLHPIARFAKEEIREKIVEELAAGRGTASFALSETGAGSNPNAGKTFAQRGHDGDWILNGEKCWVGSSSWASYLTVIAHTQDEKGKYLGQSAFLIPQGSLGLQHLEECMTMGMRGSLQGHFVMTDVHVPGSHVLGEIGKGAEVLQEVVAMGRIGINSMCIGILKTVLSRSKQWAEQRKINSGYLIDQSVVLKQLHQNLMRLEIIEVYQSRLVKWKDDGQALPDMLIAAGKIFSTEEAWKGVDFLMQVTGARGYSEHNGVSQLFRDARVLRIFEGPTESLIADLGGRPDEAIQEVLLFLSQQGLSIDIQVQNEKIQYLKRQLELRKNSKFAKYTFGEVLVYQLISWMCGNDIGTPASKWLERKMTSLITDALDFDLSILAKQQFAAQFDQMLNGHETIYTQQTPPEIAAHSPFRDLRSIESRHEYLTQGEISSQERIPIRSAPLSFQNDSPTLPSKSDTVKELQKWIHNWLEKEAGIDSIQLSPSTSFSEYGLDSSLSVRFVTELNAGYNIHVDPSIIWSYSTVDELAVYLSVHEIKSEARPHKLEKQENGLDDDFLKGLLEDELKR